MVLTGVPSAISFARLQTGGCKVDGRWDREFRIQARLGRTAAAGDMPGCERTQCRRGMGHVEALARHPL